MDSYLHVEAEFLHIVKLFKSWYVIVVYVDFLVLIVQDVHDFGVLLIGFKGIDGVKFIKIVCSPFYHFVNCTAYRLVDLFLNTVYIFLSIDRFWMETMAESIYRKKFAVTI